MAKKAALFELGTKFGDWTVVEQETKNYAGKVGVSFSRVRCVCGTEKSLPNANLRTGHSNGCGCRRGRALGLSGTTHGKSNTPLYKLWQSIKYRLEHQTTYEKISIYEPWKTDFLAFEAYIISLGPKPTPEHSLDRIDCYGDYVPGNLRWADKQVQALNRTNSIEAHLANSKIAIGQKFDMLTVLELTIKHRGSRRWPAARVRCDCGTVKVVYLSQLTSPKTKSCGCHKNKNLLLGGLSHEKPITMDGETLNRREWADKLGISPQTLYLRLRALTGPKYTKK